MTSPSLTLPTPLVNVDWLQKHLNHPDLVVIDCRFALGDPQQGRRAHEQGHVPGAYYLDLNTDLSSLVQVHGGRHPLPDLQQFGVKLASLGIASDPATAVVAYDATKGAFASRVWWLLRYLGHQNVAVLNGGFPAWQAAQYSIPQTVPEPSETGDFRLNPQNDRAPASPFLGNSLFLKELCKAQLNPIRQPQSTLKPTSKLIMPNIPIYALSAC